MKEVHVTPNLEVTRSSDTTEDARLHARVQTYLLEYLSGQSTLTFPRGFGEVERLFRGTSVLRASPLCLEAFGGAAQSVRKVIQSVDGPTCQVGLLGSRDSGTPVVAVHITIQVVIKQLVHKSANTNSTRRVRFGPRV